MIDRTGDMGQLKDWAPKTVCIVSNKEDLEADWSSFVDSCDVVIRVDGLESYARGKTGSKMSLLVEDCDTVFFSKSRVARNQPLWAAAGFVIFTNRHKEEAKHCAFREQLKAWSFFPDALADLCVAHTTDAWAVRLADHLWPEASLYFLGDIDVEARKNTEGDDLRWPTWDECSTEQRYLDRMVESGRLVPLLERPMTNGKPRANVKDAPEKDFLVKKASKRTVNREVEELSSRSPDSLFRELSVTRGSAGGWGLLVAKHTAMREDTGETGALVYNSPKQIIVDWKSGRKCYELCTNAAVWAQEELPMWAGRADKASVCVPLA